MFLLFCSPGGGALRTPQPWIPGSIYCWYSKYYMDRMSYISYYSTNIPDIIWTVQSIYNSTYQRIWNIRPIYSWNYQKIWTMGSIYSSTYQKIIENWKSMVLLEQEKIKNFLWSEQSAIVVIVGHIWVIYSMTGLSQLVNGIVSMVLAWSFTKLSL